MTRGWLIFYNLHTFHKVTNIRQAKNNNQLTCVMGGQAKTTPNSLSWTGANQNQRKVMEKIF
jgi:hypothetical protein